MPTGTRRSPGCGVRWPKSIIVVDRGTTNRAFLLTLLDRPEVSEGRLDNAWVDRLTADNGHLATAEPVALLAAAVEAYDADHAAVQAAFHVRAARGRPQMPGKPGVRLRLRYRGVGYLLDVYRTSPGTYRVTSGSSVADLAVERLDEYERRVACGGRSHRVLAVAQKRRFPDRRRRHRPRDPS